MKICREKRDETFRETKPNDRAEERAIRTLRVASEVEDYVNQYMSSELLKFEENEMRLSRESEIADAQNVREIEILNGLEIELKDRDVAERRIREESERQLESFRHKEDEEEREKRRTPPNSPA